MEWLGDRGRVYPLSFFCGIILIYEILNFYYGGITGLLMRVSAAATVVYG